MSAETHVRLRRAEAEDEALLRTVFAQARGLELGGAGLDAGVTEMLLDMQQRAQEAGYRRAHPDAGYFVVEADGVPCGRLVLDWRRDEVWVVDVALLTDARGRGIGGTLLRSLQQGAALGGRRLRLSVAKDNPARRLYERLGFSAVASDEVYVEMAWEPGAQGGSRGWQHSKRGAAA
jgi:ribosomal protein S18 acetylase RimI-like enzyme